MPSRRAILTTGLTAASAVPLAGLFGGHASAAEPTVPRTLTRRGALAGGSTRVDRTAFPLSHLGIRWTGTGQPGIRFRSESGWASWQPVHGCQGGRDGAPSGVRSALLTAPAAIGYDLDADGGTGVEVVELNTVDGPRRRRRAKPRTGMPVGEHIVPVRYLSRAAWGADESLRFTEDGTPLWGPEQFYPVQTVTVHHTAGANDDPDPAAFVRALYEYDTLVRYGDLGYHLLIDEAGTVYEGRWSGDDRQPVFGPIGTDGRPLMISAAHVGGMNSGNIGIALLGDFTERQPTRAARRALTQVLAAFCAVQLLDPRARVTFVNPVNGVQAEVPTIPGHRDWAATECPGNAFYPKLPSVRADVARLLNHHG
ncbi:peptidoglycan recognition family protein [Micromonospora profundi]|uniref:peptidoglycan recognition protein family protein n=1 Tax=Micromonospora profundi TaxID=1420889 RepID=UPI00365517B9